MKNLLPLHKDTLLKIIIPVGLGLVIFGVFSYSFIQNNARRSSASEGIPTLCNPSVASLTKKESCPRINNDNINRYKYASFTCYDKSTGILRPSSCLDEAALKQAAFKACESMLQPYCQMSPTPAPSGRPLPTTNISFFPTPTPSLSPSQIPISGILYPRTQSSKAGDVNGDGKIDAADTVALGLEIRDSGNQNALTVGGGQFKSATGADVNRDGKVDAADTVALGLVVSANTKAGFPGDLNGDNYINTLDLNLLRSEIFDGDGDSAYEVGMGSTSSTLGADVNGDSKIDAGDITVLTLMNGNNGTSPSLLGDANGDGKVERQSDMRAITDEIFDNDGNSIFEVGGGTFKGYFGADVNQDRIIDVADSTSLGLLLGSEY